MFGRVAAVGKIAGANARVLIADAHRVVPGANVALTFDDGPWPGATHRVLEVLRSQGVKATFFCVGRNAEAHPSLLREIDSEGHAIGSHSYSHPHPRYVRPKDLHEEYCRGAAVVSEALGRSVTLFRPPHGHVSLLAAVIIRKLPVVPWLWTVDPEDWRPGRRTSDIVAIARTASAGDVVLLHDWVEQPWAPSALDRSSMVAALPAIVDDVQDRGLRFGVLNS